jgi:hypothetical protein
MFNLKYGDTSWTGTKLRETGKSFEAKWRKNGASLPTTISQRSMANAIS